MAFLATKLTISVLNCFYPSTEKEMNTTNEFNLIRG